MSIVQIGSTLKAKLEDFMKTKTLELTNGIVGLIGGIILLFGPFVLLTTAVSDVASKDSAATSTSGAAILLTLVKIAILVLGIVAAVLYKDKNLVKTAPNVLMIVGGAVAFIPLLGWAGGIVAIVGGSLYLASLKNFKKNEELI